MARPRLSVALLALLALSAGLCRIGQAAPPALSRGDILFTDPAALYTGVMNDEFEFDGRGAIFKQNPSTGSVTVLSEGQTFVDPTNLAIEPSGTILVVDQNWGENQQSTGGAGGAVLRVDPSQPSASNATVLSSGGNFVDPVGITVDPSTGDIYVCDRNGAGAGMVIRLDKTTGAQTVISSGGVLINPQDIAWGIDDLLYLVDPGVDNTDTGELVQITPSDGAQSVWTSGANLVDPVGIDVDPANGNLLIADEEAGPNGLGMIIEVSHTAGGQLEVSTEGSFEHPRDVARESNTSLIVTDPVVGFGNGATFRVARSNGAQTVWATGGDTPDDFIEPLGVQVVRNLAPTVQANKTVTVNEDSVNNALNIPAPVDPEGDSFTITVNTVPTAVYGYVHVPGSTTELQPGDTLTVAQLTGLQFDTIPDAYGSAGMFIYTADDGNAASSQAITLEITALSDPPEAFDQTFMLAEDSSVAVTLPASDPDGDSLTYTVVSNPAHGTLSGTAPNVTYTPDANFNGMDSFTFKAYDGMSDSNVATIFLVVSPENDAPIVANQMATIDEDTTRVFNLTPSDPDVGDTFTYSFTGPSHGTLSGTGNSRTYTPDANYHGTDSFTFTANDGTADSNTATVSITINSVNDAPVALDQNISLNEDGSYTGHVVATDADGDAVTYNYGTGSDPHGSVILSDITGEFTYTPAPNYHGPAHFTFVGSDGTVLSNQATVTITVISTNDPPVATGNTYNTPRGTAVEPAAPGVLGNDTDVDGDTLTAKLVTNVTGGTLTLNPNGSFRYVPRIGFTGADSFTYKAYDGEEYSNVVTVTINVSPDPPASTPDGRVEGSGTIAVTGGNGTFSISARKTSGIIMGSVTYTDPNRLRTMSSTQLTSVVVTGKKARVFGKGKRPDGVLVDFVVDVNDVAEPGRLKDTFQIELSTNTTSGPGTLTLGNIIVTGGTAPAPLAPSITKTKPKRRH